MDELLSFLEEYLQLEHEIEYARVTAAPDYRAIRRKGIRYYLDEPYSLPSGPKQDLPDLAANIAPRVIFKASLYAHPDFGQVLRCVLSSQFKSEQLENYDELIEVANTDKGPALIAGYNPCHECECTGELDGDPCRACGGRGWLHAWSERHGDLGAPLEVRRLVEPTILHKRAYARED
ncbi:MAG: hypothetical protein JXR96_14485 [Deltaproteobacteria bacterium]|nr:hypothetical protein [Deltaproteobacteria bacterium]